MKESITINSLVELARLLKEANMNSIELEKKRKKEGWHGNHVHNMAIYIARKFGAFGFDAQEKLKDKA